METFQFKHEFDETQESEVNTLNVNKSNDNCLQEWMQIDKSKSISEKYLKINHIEMNQKKLKTEMVTEMIKKHNRNEVLDKN